MNKALALLLLSATSYTFQSNAAVISVDVELTERQETESYFDQNVSETLRDETFAIAPVNHTINYEVDFEQAKIDGVDVVSFDNDFFAGFFLDMSIEGMSSVGPFYSEFINSIDVSSYPDSFSFIELGSMSRISKDPNNPNGRESFGISYQITRSQTVVENNISVKKSFTYYTTFGFDYGQVDSLAEMRLSSLEGIEEALSSRQGTTTSFFEQFTLSTDRHDLTTNELIDYRGQTTRIHGTASYTLATQVSEPETFGLMLMGAGGLLLARRKRK